MSLIVEKTRKKRRLENADNVLTKGVSYLRNSSVSALFFFPESGDQECNESLVLELPNGKAVTSPPQQYGPSPNTCGGKPLIAGNTRTVSNCRSTIR
jgi:hypothetical protein